MVVHALLSKKPVNPDRVAEPCGCAHHLRVHLGGEGLYQLWDEVISQLLALLGHFLQGDQLAGPVKHCLDFFLNNKSIQISNQFSTNTKWKRIQFSWDIKTIDSSQWLWRPVGVMVYLSTVPYEQKKNNRQIILFQRIYYPSISLTGLPCHRELSIVLMSMTIFKLKVLRLNAMLFLSFYIQQ